MEIREEFSSDDERYRSKSEFLIASALKDAGVPFRYECSLYLNGYGTVYPDFTVLNKRTRRVFYHEHLGMMDDINYVLNPPENSRLREKRHHTGPPADPHIREQKSAPRHGHHQENN